MPPSNPNPNPIALPEPDTFTDRVREVVRSVPPGTLLTYGEVAVEAGRPGAARAVGRILSEHGADLPWWRIVPATGRLAPHLARRQADALRAEGVAVDGDRVRR